MSDVEFHLDRDQLAAEISEQINAAIKTATTTASCRRSWRTRWFRAGSASPRRIPATTRNPSWSSTPPRGPGRGRHVHRLRPPHRVRVQRHPGVRAAGKDGGVVQQRLVRRLRKDVVTADLYGAAPTPRRSCGPGCFRWPPRCPWSVRRAGPPGWACPTGRSPASAASPT